MFIFYYAVLADVSPPTALSPFAAAAITGGNPFRTTMLAWKYCLPAFLVPFMFTLSPEGATLLLLGEGGVLQGLSVVTTVWTFVTACIAVGALAVAFGGWFVTPASILERVLMGAGGLALLYANQTSDLIGGALVILALALHLLRGRAQLRSRPGLMEPVRILVKAAPGRATATLALDEGRVSFSAEPLFPSDVGGGPLGIADGPIWQRLTPTVPLDEANAWDVCHQLLSDGLGVDGERPVYAEPDLPQRWLVGKEAELALGLDASCDAPHQQNTGFPGDPDPLWFKDSRHSQLADALAALNLPAAGEVVRVAQLDTGYDPDRHGLPESMNFALQRNFVDSDRPNDASDRSSGPLNNLGHGTGTVGVLAGASMVGGNQIGAAPFVDVVPIRVGNTVILFYSSDIARGLRYVRELCANPATWVDVITMSMGGLASNAWADEVNALYDMGVFMVTAAGNNYANLPTKNIVFPARFNRVVAACGVMADGSPYTDLGRERMAGNYGPSDKMQTALSAFTPNAPWKRQGCPEAVDLDGSGTSCATPQVAAAAALWLQHHRAALASHTGWRRVEAVRAALFETAHPREVERFGRGELRAHAALQHGPTPVDQLRETRRDGAAFPFLRLLLGVGLAEPDQQQQMLELEALQLSQSWAVEQVLPDPSVAPDQLPPADLERVRDTLLADPRMSQALRQKLERQERAPVVPVARLVDVPDAIQKMHLANATQPKVPRPTRRRLRVFAYDPSLGTRLETLGINQAVSRCHGKRT